MTAQRVRASLTVDGTAVRRGHVWQLLIGASGRFGGGSGLGKAELSERPLVVAWVPGGLRATLPFRAIGLRRRTLEEQPGVQWWPGHELVVDAGSKRHPARWNVDGELWQAPNTRVVLRPLGPVDVVVGAP